MKFINAFKTIFIVLHSSVKRFPMTIIFSTAVAVMLISISELQPINDAGSRDMLNRITLIFALGIPLSLCIKLFFERRDSEKVYKLILYYIAGAIILLLYYFFLLDVFNLVSETRYVAVSLALYLCFLFIPYLPKKEQFEMYILKIFTGFFITLIYSIVLYSGLAAILFTIDKLLAIHMNSNAYYYTFLFVAFLFFPSYFFADIPLKNQQCTKESYPKLLRILLLYIVMPLLSTYTAILYIYFVKIIVTSQWPIGLVSHLVLWYSVIVAIVLFFITPIKDENRWANKFLVWSPKIILPILVMMFISMGIRINAYGITENRYYVIVLGLWVSGIMIYFSLAKKRINIVIPFTLSIIALISVFGPLSSYSVSKLSQNNRFEKILARNNMLKEGKVQTAPQTVSAEDKDETSRILDYFKNSHSLKEVKYLPSDFKIEDMDKVFGFSYEVPQYNSPQGYFNFTVNQSEGAVDINGYDYLFDTRTFYNKNGASANKAIDAIYRPDSSILKINYNKNEVYSKDLRLFVKTLIEKYGAISNQNTLSSTDMTFIEENGKVKVKFIFLNISGNKDVSTGDFQTNGFDFYVLVKIK